MKTTDLKPGVRYVVNKANKHGALQVGDVISLEKNGTLSCKQAQGWIEAEHVAEELAKIEAAMLEPLNGFTEFRKEHGKDFLT